MDITYRDQEPGALPKQGNETRAEHADEEAAVLTVSPPDSPVSRLCLAGESFTIGRSVKAGLDLVLETDILCSKRHAVIERDQDGRYTLYDLGSTNGTKVNGEAVDNRTLCDADEIVVGQTRLVFHQTLTEKSVSQTAESLPEASIRTGSDTTLDVPVPAEQGAASKPGEPEVPTPPRLFRLVWMDRQTDSKDFLLESEMVIGRSDANGIVLPNRSVAAQHARVVYEDDGYLLEPLHDSSFATLVNGRPLVRRQSHSLQEGDRVQLGDLVLRFETGIRLEHAGALPPR
jgi:pSer/pThr/pTyr-binding forkhead associated (FHA) protein